MENTKLVVTESSSLATDSECPMSPTPVKDLKIPSSGSERDSDSPQNITENETADSCSNHGCQTQSKSSERCYGVFAKSPHSKCSVNSPNDGGYLRSCSKLIATKPQPSVSVDVPQLVRNSEQNLNTLDGHLEQFRDNFTATVRTTNQRKNYFANEHDPEYSSKPSDAESGKIPPEEQIEEAKAQGMKNTSTNLNKCAINSSGIVSDFLDEDISGHNAKDTSIKRENSGCDSDMLSDFSSYAANICDVKRSCNSVSEPTADNCYQLANHNNLMTQLDNEDNNGHIKQSNSAQNCLQPNGLDQDQNQSFLNQHTDFQSLPFALTGNKTEERTNNQLGSLRHKHLDEHQIHQNNYSELGHYDITHPNNHPIHYQQHESCSYELEPLMQHQHNTHHPNLHEIESSQHQHFQMHPYFPHLQHNQSALQNFHEDMQCYPTSTSASQIHPQSLSISQINNDVVMEDNHDKRNTSGLKMLSPVVKGENNDDGYETSIGDILTPNSRTSSSSTSSTVSLPLANSHHLGQPNLLNLSSVPKNSQNSPSLIPKLCTPEPRSTKSIGDTFDYLKGELDSDVQMVPRSLAESATSGCQQRYAQLLMRCAGESAGHVGNGSIIPTASRACSTPLGHSANSKATDGTQTLPSKTSVNPSTMPEVFPAKKRGRKKKIGNENGSNNPGILEPITVPKERKKHDRFKGMSEEEVSKRTLPDHLAANLDIIIIGINPGLFAAYKGHHYAGPGNHFWKCLYLSGLIHEQMTAEEDYKLLDFGIGFTNIVERATKGSADLTRKEIKEGCRILMEKLQKFQPKIAVFNGKLIYEVFSGKKDFHFGRQDDFVDGTSTYIWVMPSSSARCAQLPRAADKVPFYAALKKFRDYLNGLIPRIDDNECIFNDPKYKACCETEPKKKNLIYKDISDLSNCNSINNLNNDHDLNQLGNVLNSEKEVLQNGELIGDFAAPPGKKKRGRPKKVKCAVDLISAGGNLNMRVENSSSIAEFSPTPLHLLSNYNNDNVAKCTNLTAPKKKRGRPKKIKITDSQMQSANERIEVVANCNRILEDQRHEHTSNRNEIGNAKVHQNTSISSVTESVNHDLSNNNGTNTGCVFAASLMHSPSTVDSSYCSKAMNAPLPSRAKTEDFDSNLTRNCYHQQHEHQLILQPHRYNEQIHTHSSYQTNYSTHSDLSSEISAAIAADHLRESSVSASLNIATPPYNASTRTQSSESNNNDIRYSSPSMVNEHHRKPFTYETYDPIPDRRYLSGSSDKTNEEIPHDHYINNQQSTANLTGSQQTQQLSDVSSKSLSGLESLVHQIPTISSDMSQQTQPHISNSDSSSCPEHIHKSSISNALNDFSCGNHYSPSCLYSHYASSLQHQLPPISPASKILSVSCCSTPSSDATSHKHYTTDGALYSPSNGVNTNTPGHVSISSPSSPSSSPLPSATTRISRNNNSGSFHYTNLVSNSFSVSSLTSSEHSNAYRRNFLSTPASHSHLNTSLGCSNDSGSVNNSPMYIEQPQILLPMESLYRHHNPYAQHHVYPRYSASPHSLPAGDASTSSPSPVQSPIPQLLHSAQPTHPTIHMPSPNYPYGYPNVGGYSQTHHHSVHHAPVHHPSAAGYLPTHASMFDRLKSDFGYGGF